jgi:hypothetical protein
MQEFEKEPSTLQKQLILHSPNMSSWRGVHLSAGTSLCGKLVTDNKTAFPTMVLYLQ